MQSKKIENNSYKLVRCSRNYLLFPVLTFSSIFAQAGIKYFGNLTALKEIQGSDGYDSNINAIANVLTIGSVLMQFTIIPYFVWKVMGYSKKTAQPTDLLAYESIQADVTVDESERNELKSPDETNCKNTYCKCSRRCFGACLSLNLKTFGIIIVIPTIIIGGYLGLQTMFASFLNVSTEKFSEIDSDSAKFYRVLCWILPLFSSGQFFSYNLVEGAFKNIDKLNNAITYNQYHLTRKILLCALLISIPCVLTSGPSTYYFSKTGIPNMNLLNSIFNDSNRLLTISITFAIMMLPVQAVMFVPGLYSLLHDLSQQGRKTLFDTSYSHGFSRTLFLALNVLSIIFDALSNFLLIRLSFKCMVHDFRNGQPKHEAGATTNTTALVICTTTTVVEGLADLAAASTAILIMVFNLIQLKRLMYETYKDKRSSSNMLSPRTNSIFSSDRSQLSHLLLVDENKRAEETLVPSA